MTIAGRAGKWARRGLAFASPAAICLFLLSSLSHADKVVLRIRAGNPIEKPQTVEIRSNLPSRVGTNEVISAGGLEIGYDIKNDVYFVHGRVQLGPRETRQYDVEIRDIWTIEPDHLERLETHAGSLAEKLAKTKYNETGTQLRTEIDANLARVTELQNANAIGPGVRPIQHIRAYEENVELLKRIHTDLGHLENLVLGTGQDTGDLLGESKTKPKPGGTETLPPDAYETVAIRISVRNTSPTETRRVKVERNLPDEIRIQDVLDAGELDVGTRPGSGVTYVYRHGVEIPPGETLTYEIKIRDRWNVGEPRMASLRKRVEDMQARISDQAQFAAVRKALTDVLADLDAVAARKGPAEVDDRYVAFHRRQGQQLDLIDQKVTRIESALRPVTSNTRLGFDVKAPSAKTTWGIIYGILGFLSLLSLGFFLRWYGKK